MDAAFAKAKAKFAATADVEVTHFRGGPCDAQAIACCVVVGGNGRGWTTVEGEGALTRALELAYGRALSRCAEQGEVHGGQTVQLSGLQARPELNGELGVALRFLPDAGRYIAAM